MLDRWTNELKRIVTLAHSYHEGKSCSKFGLIPPFGLRRDNMTDRWPDAELMDGQKRWMDRKIMLLSLTLP